MRVLIWTYVILELQPTFLLVISNMQNIIKLTPTEKAVTQHYAITEADMLLKIVNTDFNKMQQSYSTSSTLFYFNFFNLIYQQIQFS